MWTNKRIIFNNRRAQLPVAEFTDEVFNIYYSSRNVKNQNMGYKLTLDKNFNVLEDKLILEPGKPGSCDVSGVMPTAIWGRNLYYIGWTLRHDVPYYNYTCLAQEEDGRYTKLGPVLHADTIGDGYTGTLALLHTHHTKFAYYLNCIDWLPDENNSLQPSYNIGLAVTKDGINFSKMKDPAIDLEGEEAGISSATVIEHEGVYHMWFSVRHAKEFRTNPDKAYKIKHATSKDGWNWTRDDKFGIISEYEFESIMCAYPSVLKIDDSLYMFYNGNGFGETGIALTTMETKYL
jgi:hypothetical protein